MAAGKGRLIVLDVHRLLADLMAHLGKLRRAGGLPEELYRRLMRVLVAPLPEATAILAELYRPHNPDLPSHLRPAEERWQTLLDELWEFVNLKLEAATLDAERQALAEQFAAILPPRR